LTLRAAAAPAVGATETTRRDAATEAEQASNLRQSKTINGPTEYGVATDSGSNGLAVDANGITLFPNGSTLYVGGNNRPPTLSMPRAFPTCPTDRA
jgi:hypothetical protein